MTEETEKRRNAEVLLSKTKEQLSRKEDQYTGEVEAKQKAELSMRNLQMELRTTLSSIKQVRKQFRLGRFSIATHMPSLSFRTKSLSFLAHY